MCDRGKIQDAVKQIYARLGISLQFRLCILHILRNIKRNFEWACSDFEHTALKIQLAKSKFDYNADLYGNTA